MKKIIALLVTACLFVACEKEGGNSSLDGTTWKCDGESIVLKGGYASSYFKGNLVDTQSYSIKGNKIVFKNYLWTYGDRYDIYDYYYDLEGHFNDDKSKLYLSIGTLRDGKFGYPEEYPFNRVVE